MRQSINLADALRKPTLRIMIIAASLALPAIPQSTQQHRFLARMPLDSEIIQLMPAKQKFTIMLTWDCREMEDWQLLRSPGKTVIKDTEGNEVHYYPRELRFRFTISGNTKFKLERKALEYETALGPQTFIDQLSFRLKRFEGLEVTDFDPVRAEIIGVPADIPYDERIYVIVFKVPKIPIEDRFALEVLDVEGNRVAKFPFFLM
jgi:hypothetical protein